MVIIHEKKLFSRKILKFLWGSVIAAVFPAKPEIAQVSGNHEKSAYKSKDVFLVARSHKCSCQKEAQPQDSQHYHVKIPVASAAEEYGYHACGNDQKEQQLMERLFKYKCRTQDRKQYERHRRQKTMDDAETRERYRGVIGEPLNS